MEKSLKSEERGRVHLHVFMEFTKSVDWTSLRPVVFMAVTPDASPCVASSARLLIMGTSMFTPTRLEQ